MYLRTHVFFLIIVILGFSLALSKQKRLHRELKHKRGEYKNYTPHNSNNTYVSDSVYLLKELHYGSDLYPVNDIPLDMIGDADGNVYVIAIHVLFGKGSMRFIKYDASGNQLWKIQNDNVTKSTSTIAKIAIDSSQNIVVVYGAEWTEYTLMQYSPQGNLLWSTDKHYAGVADLEITSDGNIVVLGNDFSDLLLTQYSAVGTMFWEVFYNGPLDDADEGNAMALDDNNNIYITGYSYFSNEDDIDFITQKYSSIGTLLWTKSFTESGISDDEALYIALDKDTNVIVT